MNLTQLGIFLLFLSIILIFIGSIFQSKSTESKVLIGGFIGPIPFGFMNDKRMLPLLVGLILLSILVIFLLKKYF